jgi:stringent starvation protein B
MHEWMGDNVHTPHIVVDAGVDGVTVPPERVKDG